MIIHMLNRPEENVKQEKRQFMFVRTLAEESSDSFYAKTREFYRAVGFLPLFTDMQIWGKDNPCLVMVMHII